MAWWQACQNYESYGLTYKPQRGVLITLKVPFGRLAACDGDSEVVLAFYLQYLCVLGFVFQVPRSAPPVFWNGH